MAAGVLLLVLALVGIGRAESARVRIGPGDVAYQNGATVTLTGTITAEPDVRDTGITYVVSADHLLHGTRAVPVTGQVEVHAAAGQIFEEGDRLQLTGLLSVPRNYGATPYRSILANRGIFSEMSFPRAMVIGHVSLGLLGVAEDVRQWIASRIDHALPEPEAALLIAIVVGGRSAQLGGLAPILIATGLIHLIAVSGLKIAIVAGTVSEAVRRSLPARPRWWCPWRR